MPPELGNGANTQESATALRAIISAAAEPAKEERKPLAALKGAAAEKDSPQAETEVEAAPEGEGVEKPEDSKDATEVEAEEPSGPITIEDLAKHHEVETDALFDNLTVPVKVDGKTESVTLRDLTKGYASQSENSRRANSLIAEKKQWDTVRQTEEKKARESVAVLTTVLQSLQGRLIAKAPDPSLRTSDPDEYTRQYTAHVASREEFQRLWAPVTGIMTKLQREQQQRLNTFKTEQQAVIRSKHPEFFHEKTRDAKERELVEYATSKGFTDSDLEQLIDARMFDVMVDALNGHAVKSGKALGEKKAKPIASILKPGRGSDVKAPVRAEVKSNLARLQQTGSVSDAARLLGSIRRAPKK